METLLWDTSWENYMLFLGAFQTDTDDEDSTSSAKPKMEVRDINDIF